MVRIFVFALLVFFMFSCKQERTAYKYYEDDNVYLLKVIPFGFDDLDINEKLYVYYLTQAAKWGDKIYIDQKVSKNNLLIYFLGNIYKYKNYLKTFH